MASDEEYLHMDQSDAVEASSQSATPDVPKVLRTAIYLAGALGTVMVLADVEGTWLTVAKVAMGLASILGFTFNPVFGVGSRK